MKTICVLLLLAAATVDGTANAQKMHVKVLDHQVNGVPFTRVVPGVATSSGSATVYGNTASASGNSVYLPPHVVEGSLTHIQMLLLLTDGRRVGVYCNDHIILMGPRIHACKNPEVDEFEADFSSGEKVKLTWGVGLDGKKKVSEDYIVGKVFPASPPEPIKP